MDKSVIFHSRRLIEEMKVFIWKNGKAEAQNGYNDDLIISFSIGQYLRDTSFKFKQQNLDTTKAVLNNTYVNKPSFMGGYNANNVQNPYAMEINGQHESIRWLF